MRERGSPFSTRSRQSQPERVSMELWRMTLLLPTTLAQWDYAEHSTDTAADWQACGTCTHADEGTKCTDGRCIPDGDVSKYGTYNLQLYGFSIESRHFVDQTCGNAWLDFYDACSDAGYVTPRAEAIASRRASRGG